MTGNKNNDRRPYYLIFYTLRNKILPLIERLENACSTRLVTIFQPVMVQNI